MFSSSSFYFQEEIHETVETEEESLIRTVVDAGVVEPPVSAVGEVDQPDVHEILITAGSPGLGTVEAGVVGHRSVPQPQPHLGLLLLLLPVLLVLVLARATDQH